MKKLLMVMTLVILTAIMLLSSCASKQTTTRPTTSAPKPTYTQTTARPTTTMPAPKPTAPSAPAPTITVTGAPAQPPETIGLATGGAKDISNFRENIENDYLPLPTDITYEGLFYDYYFDTGMQEETKKLFAPSYSYAVTRDPLSHQTEYYLSVGLNSGIRQDEFERKTLNLVIVLDSSGSMGEQYNQYYYDRYGKQQDAYEGEGVARPTKMDTADSAVVSILNQLEDYDRFAIVTYNSKASLLKPMGLVRKTDMGEIKDNVYDIRAGGSTNLAAGMNMGLGQFKNFMEVDSYEYENRMIILTDAQPNTGDISLSGLGDIMYDNAENRIYTSFIGIGVDFNSELIELISKVKGANYYSVHSPREFRQRVDEEFDFMVTPLVFNVVLNFESRGWRIDKVFGSPEADQSTGRLMKINTLFPSRSEGGENKGGIVILKLRRITSSSEGEIYLRTTYKDRDGRTDGDEKVIYLESTSPEYFDNSGIRKGVLLTRYAALLKNWIIDERDHVRYSDPWEPCIDEDTGIIIPPEDGLGQWERQSLPLTVSSPYKRIFRDFREYLKDEMDAIQDYTLDQEVDILNTLCN
jgi:Ca-activated chloride channel family protein